MGEPGPAESAGHSAVNCCWESVWGVCVSVRCVCVHGLWYVCVCVCRECVCVHVSRFVGEICGRLLTIL